MCVLICVVSACASSEPVDRVAAAPDPGWVLYTELEERLMRAHSLELHATMTASGVVDAVMNADLWIEGETRARFALKGSFEGQPVDALFISDGTHARVRDTTAAPRELRGAFVRGLMSMGLLHNAALLVAGRAPERAEGGAREFMRAERQRLAAEGLAIDLDVIVNNEHVAEATLALDAEGLPQDRTQLVHFDGGDMTVREIYTGVELDRALDPALFSLAPASTPPTATDVAP
jgi:hypothetical protein